MKNRAPRLAKPRVYIETTVISYLTARPCNDLIRTAHQEITRQWWQDARPGFDLFVSGIVANEIAGGDAGAARARLDAIHDIPRLETTEEAIILADKLILALRLPARVAADAFHIATATVHGMDYLLSWNCTHIANAKLSHTAHAVCIGAGYRPPIICTPQELPEA